MPWTPLVCRSKQWPLGRSSPASTPPRGLFSWELRRNATGVEACEVEGGETSIFEGDFESSAHCSAVSTATANAEKPGRKGKYALFFWGGMVKGVVLNIHVTVATGLPKDTQIEEPVLKRERVSNPHDAVVVGTGSFPPRSSPCLCQLRRWEPSSYRPRGSVNAGEGRPGQQGTLSRSFSKLGK